MLFRILARVDAPWRVLQFVVPVPPSSRANRSSDIRFILLLLPEWVTESSCPDFGQRKTASRAWNGAPFRDHWRFDRHSGIQPRQPRNSASPPFDGFALGSETLSGSIDRPYGVLALRLGGAICGGPATGEKIGGRRRFTQPPVWKGFEWHLPAARNIRTVLLPLPNRPSTRNRSASPLPHRSGEPEGEKAMPPRGAPGTIIGNNQMHETPDPPPGKSEIREARSGGGI